jgi:SAM-dependent methyltransferase
MAGNPYAGRRPTSHERRFGQAWDASYLDGPPPWDVEGPQPAIVRLADAGAFAGDVLDAGCGTGENALHVAALGRRVVGFDVAETAVATAREKAAARGLDAEFVVADALQLERLGRAFDTVLDCGLFHTFDGDERREYVSGLARVTKDGGHVHLLCFSDAEPETPVPHPVSERELRDAFTGGWRVVSLTPERLRTRLHEHGAPAWLATIERRSGAHGGAAPVGGGDEVA